MSKSQFRSTTPEDAPAVTAFLTRIFDRHADDPGIQPRHLFWKNWEPRLDWPDSRGFVMVNGEEIVACCTVVPLDCGIGTERFRMVHLIDWAAEPKVPGVGVTLLKRVGQLADVTLVAGGSEMTQKILPALGFKVNGEVGRYVLPLHPLKRLTGQKLHWRLGAQFGRSVLWKYQAPRARVNNWEMRRVREGEMDGIPWPRSTAQTIRFERSAELMAYYLRCDAAPMELYAVSKSGRTHGYFLLAQAPAQVRIVDCWMEDATREDWTALVQLAVNQAATNRKAAEVVSLSSDSTLSQALTDAGFHEHGRFPLRLLVGKARTLPEIPVGFHMLDGDAAYLHKNRVDFWA